MRIGVIVNPRSGRSHVHRLTSRIEGVANALGADVSIHSCEATERIETIARRIVPGVDAIGALGGDGTLNGVVNGVLTSARPETPVFFIPAGRGKDTARSIPSWEEKLLDGQHRAFRTRTVDLGRVTTPSGLNRYFINESSIGVSAFSARKANRYPRSFGKGSYLIGALHGLVAERPFAAELETVEGGNCAFGRSHIIAISNGRFFGGGLEISPLARVDNGMLNVVALADASLLDVGQALPKLLRGTHLNHPKVIHMQTAGITVTSPQRPRIESDGEQWTTAPATFTVTKNALTWLEPE